MRTVALVVNPISGKGVGPGMARTASAVLTAAGRSVEVHETTGPGDALAWVRERGGAFDAVVAVGGDGTLREVIEGLREPRPVGLLPAGTANVVARDLGIPRSARRAARALLAAVPRPLDVGRANGRPFLAMVGVGFDARVVHRLADLRQGPITMASYVRPGLQTFLRHRPTPLLVAVDGGARRNGVFGAVVSNSKNYGGVFSVTPDARLDDGWLDYQLQLGRTRLALLRCSMAALLRRRTSSRHVLYGRGRHFEITAPEPVPVQVDGDEFGTTPVEIGLEAGSVTVLAPAEES